MNVSAIIAALLIVPAATAVPGATAAATAYWGRSTWTDPERGFLWYAPVRPPPASPPAPEQVSRPPLEALSNQALGAEIERLLAVAVESPSEDAVRAYLAIQQYAMERATRFSDVFRRTVWTNPQFDYSLRGRPTNAMALAAFDAARDQRQRATSEQLARTHGLFFFFQGDCAYCHQLAPILAMYGRAYGMEVFPVSLDGATLPEFPDARRDNGIAATLGITTVPALFLADKASGRIVPVGYGVLSLEEIVTRVHVLTQTSPGQEY